jgi:hypothetical protein
MSTSIARRQAVAEAEASLRIEGLSFSSANTGLLQSWAAGEVSTAQARDEMLARARQIGREEPQHREPVSVFGR